MPLPHNDSLVSYPSGGLTEHATVLYVAPADGRTLVLTDRTPCHPLDPRWPDQGPDRGVLTFDGVSVPLDDCVIGATDGSELFVGDQVPVRRGEPGWAFVVVHMIPTQTPAPTVGERVTLAVDAVHRAELSAGHTGCHVAALALNAALAGRWRKPAGTDGLGYPNFDQLAIVSSSITPNGAVDTYRLGRSLRKKGFDVDGLESALPGIAAAANERLVAWVAAGASVAVVSAGPGLTDLREWVCTLPEGTVRIPCGGTHLTSLAETESIVVDLLLDVADGELTMTTSVVPAVAR